MWILYFIVSFIIIFINYKQQWKHIIYYTYQYNSMQKWSADHINYIETWKFWKYFVFIPLFWIIIIPIYYIILFAWKGLDFIYNKYFEK